MKQKSCRKNSKPQQGETRLPPHLEQSDAEVTTELKKRAAAGDPYAEAALVQYASTMQ